MKPMNRALRDRWVAALRSGQYPQSKGSLRTHTGYCCLGVLCDVVDPKAWRLIPHTEVFTHSGEGAAAYLSLDITERTHVWEDAQVELVTMNDNNWPFRAIAQWIERNL